MDIINKTDEELKYCYKYPHPSVTTDCVIFGFDGTKLRVLLQQDETAGNVGTNGRLGQSFAEERSLPLSLQQGEI